MPVITAVNLSQSFKKFCVDYLSIIWGVCWELSPCTWEGAQNINHPPEDSVFLVWGPLRQRQDMTEGHLPRVTKSSRFFLPWMRLQREKDKVGMDMLHPTIDDQEVKWYLLSQRNCKGKVGNYSVVFILLMVPYLIYILYDVFLCKHEVTWNQLSTFHSWERHFSSFHF